jgi:predicted nucleic acid-binding protein
MIDYLRCHAQARQAVESNIGHMITSAMVVSELFAGVKGDKEEAELRHIISDLTVMPVTTEIATEAGLFKRAYGKSHGISLVDAVVAATAISLDAELLTLNVRHFPMMPGLKPAYVKA